MSTSGSTTFNLDARQLITFALQKVRVSNIGEDPAADDMAVARQDLNLMLKGLQLRAPSLWRQTFGSVALVAGQASYVLSPRPFRVHEARYRSASGVDIPMFDLTRQDYVDLPLKTAQGVPTNYYVDYQRQDVTLYVWPVPSSVTTETIQFSHQRVFEDIASLNDDIDIPQEHLECVGYLLAARLLDTYGKEMPTLLARSEQLMEQALASDREPVVRFVPERRI